MATEVKATTANPLSKYTVEELPAPTAPASGSVLSKYSVEEAPDAEPADTRSVGEQIGSGMLSGAKQGLAPYAVTKEDRETPQTGIEMAANVLTDLASGIAASAGTGALIGSAVPGLGTAVGALVGPIVYGIYSAIGEEISRGDETDDSGLERGGRVLLNTALEVNPLLKGASKLNKLSRLAAQSLGSAGKEYSYTDDAKRAAAAGVFSLLAAPFIYRGMRKTDVAQPTTSGVDAIVKLARDEDETNIAAKAWKRLEAEDPDLPADAPLDFKRYYMNYPSDVSVDAQFNSATKSQKLHWLDDDFRSFENNKARKQLGRKPTNEELDQRAESYVRPAEWPKDFKQYWLNKNNITNKSVIDSKFDELASKTDKTNLNEAWRTYRHGQLLTEEAGKTARQYEAALSSSDVRDPLTTMGKWFKDTKFIGRDVDRKFNIELEDTIDEFGRARERHEVLSAGLLHSAMSADKLSRKAGLSRQDVGRLLAGDVAGVSPNAKTAMKTAPHKVEQAIDAWREAWDSAGGVLRSSGYDVGHLDKYIPLTTMRGPEMAHALQTKLRHFADTKLLDANGKPVKSIMQLVKAGDDDAIELVDFAKKFLKKDEVTDLDIATMADAAMEASKTSTGFGTHALFERRGDLPDWAREWDAGKLFSRYINSNVKAVNYNDAFRRGYNSIETLKALGLKDTAQYMEEYLKHMSGSTGSGVAQAWAAGSDALRLKGLQIGGAKGKAVQAIPDFVGWLNSAVYPAYLGLNLKAALRNFTQPMLVTAPEFGGKYGYALVAKATMAAAKDARTKGLNMEDVLKSKGMLGGMVRTDLGGEAAIGGQVKGGLDKVNELAMVMYSNTDTINRYVTMKVGQQWAKDLANDVPDAIAALKRLSPAYQNKLTRALKGAREGDDMVNRLGDVLGDYLIGKTQFRYGKEGMNQFGREFGRAFSMFTKWPAMIGSDMVELTKRKEFGIMAKRYLAPYMGLLAADKVLDMTAKDTDTEAWKNYLIGDMSEFSPAQALTGAGAISGGPLVKATLAAPGVIKQALTSDDAGKAAGDAAKTAGRGVLKTYVPPLSAIVNELDRVQAARDKVSFSRDLVTKGPAKAVKALPKP